METTDKRQTALRQHRDLLIQKIREFIRSRQTAPWMPDLHPPQNINGRRYDNMNQIILSLQCQHRSFKTGVFLTAHQIQEDNIRINKGERCTYISHNDVHYVSPDKKKLSVSEYNQLDSSEKQKYTIQSKQRYYGVFNIEQTNFPEKHPDAWNIFLEQYSAEKHAQGDDYINPGLDKLIKDNGWICNITLDTPSSPGYSWREDNISMASLSEYESPMEYYSNALHAMANSTGHRSRLARGFDKFEDSRFAKEELVSSLAASLIGKRLDMTVLPHQNCHQYLEQWIQSLENDPGFILSLSDDIKRAAYAMHKGIDSVIHKIHLNLTARTIIVEKFDKDEIDKIIYAYGQKNDGTSFKSPVYKRGNEYCFTTGSIISGDLSTHFLDHKQIAMIENLKQPAETVQSSCRTIITKRKTLFLSSDSASITYNSKEYDAGEILKTLKQHKINPQQIPDKEWKILLMGQGVQLDKNQKALFSIIKTPKGYGMRTAHVIKSTSANQEIQKS